LATLHFLDNPAKCEVAHTSPLRLFPIKIQQRKTRRGTHGIETSYGRDCCNGADHPNGVGHAELVTDLPSSTFAFVLRLPISFLPPTLDARQAGGVASSFVIGFAEQMFGGDEQVSGHGQSD
jgi:hypothetical protein